jgi:hypothetical protein
LNQRLAMDALNPTANAAKNVARRSGTRGHAATADFVADESNHADVQHIPPGTVADDPEPTTAAETCNGPTGNHQRLSKVELLTLPTRGAGKVRDSPRYQAGRKLILFCGHAQKDPLGSFGRCNVEKRNQPKYKHRGERQGLETKEFT